MNCVLFEKRRDSLIRLTTQEIPGMRLCGWLRHCATSRKVAGSIPDVVVFIDIILPAALWPWGDSVSNGNDYQEYSLRVKAPVRRADKLTTRMCRLPWNMAASKSWKPQGLSRRVQSLFELLLEKAIEDLSFLRVQYLLKPTNCTYLSNH